MIDFAPENQRISGRGSSICGDVAAVEQTHNTSCCDQNNHLTKRTSVREDTQPKQFGLCIKQRGSDVLRQNPTSNAAQDAAALSELFKLNDNTRATTVRLSRLADEAAASPAIHLYTKVYRCSVQAICQCEPTPGSY